MNVREKFSELAKKNTTQFLYFILISFLVFWPSFINLNYFWDDERFIFLSPTVLQAPNILSFWNFNSEFFKSWPLGFSFYWLLLKYSPFQSIIFYKSLNIFFHGINAFLVQRILKKFNFPFPFLLALVFLIHPLHVETVSWIFQLLTILSFTFFLLSFLFLINFINIKRYRFLILSFVFFLFSIWTKSISLLSPLFFLSLFYAHSSKKNYYFSFLPFIFASVVIGIVNVYGTSVTLNQKVEKISIARQVFLDYFDKSIGTIYTPPAHTLKTNGDKIYYDFLFNKRLKRDTSTFDRKKIFTQAPWHYLSKTLLPINLQFIYPSHPYSIWLNGIAIWSIFILPIFLAIYFKDKLWYLIPVLSLAFLAPYLGITNITFYYWSSVSDRYTYYFILVLIICLGLYLKNRKSKNVYHFLLIYLLVLFGLNIDYGLKFNQPILLYKEIVEYKPHPVIYSLLFEQYLFKLDAKNAEQTLKAGLSRFPDDPQLGEDLIRLSTLKNFTEQLK